MASTAEQRSPPASGSAARFDGLPHLSAGKLAGCCGVFVVFAIVPFFSPGSFALYLLSLSVIFAIIATGLNITNGYLGLVNLAVGGEVAVGSYSCVLALLRGMPLTLALLIAVVIGAVVASLIFVTFARLEGFFFGLATLAASEIIRLLIRNLDGLTNGVRGLRGYAPLTQSPETTYWILLGVLTVILVGVWIAAGSSLGLQWRAIRDNRGKAVALGIPVLRLQFLAYVISGAVMSLGGALLALLLQYIEPSIADLKTLIQTVVMVALGGPGTVTGPIIGAILITLIPELLRVANELRLIIYGATLMVIVLAMPGGVLGTIRRIGSAPRRHAPRHEEE